LSQKTLPTICPSCKGLLKVQRLTCPACETSVEGLYDLPVLAQLLEEDQEFILHLIQASGSLKDMASHYGISYPTIRNRLDSLIEKISKLKKLEKKKGE
jgi:hypothetical protein